MSEFDGLQHGIHPADTHVGQKVRMRRKMLGLSQQQLGDQIGLTFQQIQKYERGANRISASKLWDIARVLKTPIQVFFEGYDDGRSVAHDAPSDSERDVTTFLRSSEGQELAESFPRISNSRHRRKLVELVQALATDPEPTS